MSYKIGEHPLFLHTEEERQRIIKEMGLNRKTLTDDIDIIVDWFQKQPHLADAPIEKSLVEILLIMAKGSVEKAKQRLDIFYKYRFLAPQLIKEREKCLNDPSHLIWDSFIIVTMPNLFNGKRITVAKILDPEPSNFGSEVFYRNSFMMSYKIGEHPLFLHTEEERQRIIKEMGLNRKTLTDDIDIIVDWFQKQPHLADAPIEKSLVEILLIMAKGSVEKAKQRLDIFYKYRFLAPQLIKEREKCLNDPSHLIWDSFIIVTMPNLFNGKRITVAKILDPEPSNFGSEVFYRNSFMLLDLRLKYDYMMSDIWIVDMQNVGFSHVLRMNPSDMKKATHIFHEGICLRVDGIHIINSSPALLVQQKMVISIVKQFISPKIMERLMIHDSIEDLYKHIPKKYVPKDYDGDEPSLEELREQYEKFFRSSKDFLLHSSKMVSDESKRPGSNICEMAGTFKKLELD